MSHNLIQLNQTVLSNFWNYQFHLRRMCANPTDCWWGLTWDLAYMSNTAYHKCEYNPVRGIFIYQLSCNATYLQNHRPSASHVKQNLVEGSDLSNTPVFPTRRNLLKNYVRTSTESDTQNFVKRSGLKNRPVFPNTLLSDKQPQICVAIFKRIRRCIRTALGYMNGKVLWCR